MSGSELLELIEAAGETQASLARHMNVSSALVNYYVREENPRPIPPEFERKASEWLKKQAVKAAKRALSVAEV